MAAMRGPLRIAALAAVLAAVAAAPGLAASPPAGPLPGPGERVGGGTGQVLAPVTARVAPDMRARRVTVLHPIAPLGGGVTTVQITARRAGTDGRQWVRVRLPIRPNGAQGWIPLDVLRLGSTPLRIHVSLGQRRLTVFRSGRAIRQVRIAVGKPGTPTPVGRFAVAELIRTHTPGAFLGPVVFPLTGYSETLNEFAGGNGRVAIHGTSLPRLLGTAASNGCIRMHNRDAVALSRIVRPGTPVRIVR